MRGTRQCTQCVQLIGQIIIPQGWVIDAIPKTHQVIAVYFQDTIILVGVANGRSCEWVTQRTTQQFIVIVIVVIVFIFVFVIVVVVVFFAYGSLLLVQLFTKSNRISIFTFIPT